jgi:hypothetical protein
MTVQLRATPAQLHRAAALLRQHDHAHITVARILEHVAAGSLTITSGEHVHPRDILGNAAVRRECGNVTRHTLIRWRAGVGVREPFPEPIRQVNGTELWSRAQVRAWLEDNRP